MTKLKKSMKVRKLKNPVSSTPKSEISVSDHLEEDITDNKVLQNSSNAEISLDANETAQNASDAENTSDIDLSGHAADAESTHKSFVRVVPKSLNTNNEQIKAGIGALFKYVEKTSEGQTELFAEEQPLFLQVIAVKVPKVPSRQIRFTLLYSLHSDSGEICLIVPDIAKGKEYEDSRDHYEQLLQSKGVTNIKTVMPFYQFRNEYADTFITKQSFFGLYDCVLVDGRIHGKVVHKLGSTFMKKRKIPIPIKLDEPNLKYNIEKRLLRTAMKIHSFGDTFMVQVGHTKMGIEKVYGNVLTIIDELSDQFPGGWENVRSLSIKTDRSVAIPLYLTLSKSGNCL